MLMASRGDSDRPLFKQRPPSVTSSLHPLLIIHLPTRTFSPHHLLSRSSLLNMENFHILDPMGDLLVVVKKPSDLCEDNSLVLDLVTVGM